MILLKIAIFVPCKCTFVGMVCCMTGCEGMFPGKEGGIQVLAGLASSNQTLRSFWKTPSL
jgi:hypothetical protein